MPTIRQRRGVDVRRRAAASRRRGEGHTRQAGVTQQRSRAPPPSKAKPAGCLPWGVKPRLLQIKEFRLANAELVHLFHLRLELGRWLLLLTFARFRFGGEVHGRGVKPALVADAHAADDVGAKLSPLGGVLVHDLAGTRRVTAAALDDLDEPRGVRVA